MLKLFSKTIPALIFWAIFAYVVLQVPYPDSLTQANLIQLLSFFLPLFLAFIFTINFFLKNIFSSLSISLGLISLLFLKALDSLNLVTTILTVITVWLLISYFRKAKRKGLTSFARIPKLNSLQRRKK